MMGAMLKGEKDLLTLQIQCSGPAKGLSVTADSKGNVKGYVSNPEVMLPPNEKGKLDVGGALGVGVLSVSIVATVWSSAMGFASLIRGLEDIYEQPRRAGFLMRRARGIIYTLGMLLMMILSIVLGGFGRQIKALAEKYLPGSQPFFSFLLHFRFVVVIAVLTLFFAAIFRWSTGLRPRFGEVLPGALTAAVGWSVFSWAFSTWVSVTGSYGTYGSLVTVVVVMLWLYYCQYILLLSACLNRALPKLRRRGEPEPESEPAPKPDKK